MAYYSFVATAKEPIGFQDPLICLDTGVNIFTAHTDDIDELLKLLVSEGVQVTQVNRLDQFEEVTLADLPLLPRERAEMLLPNDSSPPLLQFEDEDQA